MKKAIFFLLSGSILIAIGLVFGFRAFAQHGMELFSNAAHRVEKEMVPAEPPSTESVLPMPPEEPVGVKCARLAISGTIEERRQALQSLTLEETSQPQVVEFLSGVLVSSPAAKSDVLPVLAALAPKNPQTIPMMTSMLADASMKREVIETLGQLGPLAASAAPDLKKMAANKHEKKSIRTAASAALVHMKPVVEQKKVTKPSTKKKIQKVQKTLKKKKKS